MKQNKFIKYSLMAMFLFMGIFGLNIDVEAADKKILKQCTYNFRSLGLGFETKESAKKDCKLYLNKVSVLNGEDYYEVVSTCNIKPRTGLNVRYNSSNECPTIYVYQRRGGIAKGNTWDFYLIGNALNSNYDDEATLVNACSAKNDDDEVKSNISGKYKCGNFIGPLTGTDTTPISETKCTTSDFNGVTKKVETAFTPVTNSYNSYKTQMSNQTKDASGATAQQAYQICGELKNTANSYVNKLQQEYNSLGIPNLIQKYAWESYSCSFTTSQAQKIRNDFANKMQNYSRNILSIADTQYAKCLATSNATAEEVEDAIEDAKEDSKEKAEEVSNSVKDTFEDFIKKLEDISLGEDTGINCEGLLGQDLLDLINDILRYVQIGAPILLIVLGMVDFAQAVLTDDKDALKKATSKFIRRAIVCVAIFFVPIVLNLLLNMAESAGLNLVDDPLCGIR